jgi:hypothetical protein
MKTILKITLILAIALTACQKSEPETILSFKLQAQAYMNEKITIEQYVPLFNADTIALNPTNPHAAYIPFHAALTQPMHLKIVAPQHIHLIITHTFIAHQNPKPKIFYTYISQNQFTTIYIRIEP